VGRRLDGRNIAIEASSESKTPVGYPPSEEFLAVQLLFSIE
jgi:hypothetical protein